MGADVYVILAWFADRPLSDQRRRAARDRHETALATVVPESYLRHEFGGDDWGVTVLHSAEPGAYRWPVLATDASVSAVSLGLPVGLAVPDGPVGLARRLLSGADVHREVVPPFGLVAVDRAGRCVVQQDWLGMCRLFRGEADGVTALGNRPSLLASFLHGGVEPDLEGWASYTLCGHFGGEFSPVRGVRMFRPGERVTAERRAGGGWRLDSSLRYAVDDVVLAGIEAQGRPLDEPLDLAAQGLAATAAGIRALYADEITLGLSGGKDSRLIAASLIAAGHLPGFVTNEDTRAEGEVARELVQILRDRRGLNPRHKLVLAGAPAAVLDVGLHERVERLQRFYDYQFPSTYAVRPAVSPRLPEKTRAASLTGAGGELAIGYWYPKPDAADQRPERAALSRLLGAVPAGVVADVVAEQEHDRISGLLAHATAIGVRDLHLADYLYLVERVRRWYASAYTVGMVTPFLSPHFVSASFALTPEQKRERVMHTQLMRRLMPEWADVRYVSVSTGRSTATRIWDGDGVRAVCDLLDTAAGSRLGRLVRPDPVRRALRLAARGSGASQKTLQQFAWLAVAAHRLEPDAVREPTGATYALITATSGPRPLPARALARLNRTSGARFGRQIWTGLRRPRNGEGGAGR